MPNEIKRYANMMIFLFIGASISQLFKITWDNLRSCNYSSIEKDEILDHFRFHFLWLM